MAKAHRSPLLGYNHNIGHLGRVFHVQTEDSGPISPRVFTHLFHEGIILVSRKIEYETMLGEDKVRVLMQTQHRAVIKELAAGAFNERIIAFFRARGVELAVAPIAPAAPAAVVVGNGTVPGMASGSAVPGAVPAAPIMGDASGEPVPPAAAAAPAPVVPATPAAVVPAAPPAHTAPPRRNTRPIETGRTRKPTPPPVTVRPPDSRRPPFVRSGAPAVAKTASADGVVVQRSVVVGGSSTGEGRPRIRPPVPYIVTGGSHPVRPAATTTPAAAPTATTMTAAATAKVTATATVGTAATAVAATGSATEVKVSGGAQAPGLAAADAPARTGVFGPPVPDDKSLDEVILEYLSEDGE